MMAKNKNTSLSASRREPLTDTQLLMTITICIFFVMYGAAMLIWGGGFLRPQKIFDLLNDNAYLLIITLMFNYVANYFASYLTNYVFLDPYALDKLAIQTQKIEGSILPRLFPKYTTHWGFIIALVVVILVDFMVRKTSFGYKARMGGLNAHFAEYGGIESRKTMYKVLMISGAVAGLGGACEVLGTKFRYVDEMITSPGYSWSGITASLMSNYNIIGTLFSSIFLAGITIGGASIELTMNIPSEITQVIQGVISMLITAKIAIDWAKLSRRKESAEQ